jgi:hypothetical protein
MRDKLKRAGWRSRYRLRKQVIEPVFGRIKQARGFRQILLRGIDKVKPDSKAKLSPLLREPNPLPLLFRRFPPSADYRDRSEFPQAQSNDCLPPETSRSEANSERVSSSQNREIMLESAGRPRA